MSISLLRLPQVIERTGICKAKIYQLMKLDKFPASIKVGNSTAWVSSEVDAWIDNTIAEARKGKVA